MIDETIALEVVISCLREALEQAGGEMPSVINRDTVIVGKDAVLDSIGVVSLIVDVEQKLEMEHDVTVTLASDKAMSKRTSPFRTAGVLAEHICETVKEGEAA